jgi:hypothetical protein
VEGDGRRSGPHETATGAGHGPGWGRHGGQRDHPGGRGYLTGRDQLNEPVRYDDPDVRYGDPSAAEDPDRVGVSNGSDFRHGRHRGGRGAPVRSATAGPPDRYDDYWLAGSPPRPPAPFRPLSYPPVVYQDSVQIPVPTRGTCPRPARGAPSRPYRRTAP